MQMSNYRQGLDKKLTFGKHKGSTPRELIDSENGYIEYIAKKGFARFTREVHDYIEKK